MATHHFSVPIMWGARIILDHNQECHTGQRNKLFTLATCFARGCVARESNIYSRSIAPLKPHRKHIDPPIPRYPCALDPASKYYLWPILSIEVDQHQIQHFHLSSPHSRQTETPRISESNIALMIRQKRAIYWKYSPSSVWRRYVSKSRSVYLGILSR